MKHGLCKCIVALFLMAAVLVGASALAERVIDGGLTDAQEVVKEVGEVDLYAPVVYAGTEQADAGEKDEQSAMEHNAEYYYEINSTFPDAVFRQYIRQYYDWDGDGYLSDEECEAVTCIDVENMGIKSLEGMDAMNRACPLESAEAFCQGFRLGARMMMDVLNGE